MQADLQSMNHFHPDPAILFPIRPSTTLLCFTMKVVFQHQEGPMEIMILSLVGLLLITIKTIYTGFRMQPA